MTEKTDIGPTNPFHIRTLAGDFHTGWKTNAEAKRRADLANKGAEIMGLTTRYVVKPRKEQS